jgi:hypothetical protein
MAKKPKTEQMMIYQSMGVLYLISALRSGHIGASLEDLDSDLLDSHMEFLDVFGTQLTKILESDLKICADDLMVIVFVLVVDSGFEFDLVSFKQKRDFAPFFS